MFEDFYMPQFDADYFNSPAFQQAIAAGMEQYSPTPVEPVYYAPPPVYTPAPQVFRGIGGRGEYAEDIYDVQPAEEVYVSQGPSAEEIAAAQAEADRAAAQAEADRVAAEQEYFARVEAERLAVARAQALEAEAERTQNEAIAARAEQARIAVEQAAAERVAAEQVAAQAQVVEQQAVQTQAVVQAEVAATFAAAPEPAYTPEPEPLGGIGRAVDENYYTPEVQAPEQIYTPAPVAAPEADVVRGIGGREVSAEPDYGFAPEQIYAPEPFPVYTPPSAPAYYEPAPVAGIGREVNYNDSEQVLSPEPVYVPQPAPEPVYTPAVEPMAVEAEPVAGIGSPAVAAPSADASAPYDLSSLSGLDLSGLGNLYGMNFASDFGGGAMGGIYPDDPNTEYIAAPLSNKGNATSQTGGNAFEVRVDQPVRLVDLRTNQVVFEGTGYDAARQAVATGQNLSDTLGRKAQYVIQTADPTGNYSTVAYEKANKSTLGEIANVAGTLLPLALIPLTAGASAGSLLASTAGKIGLGTALGAAGAGLKGDNILKGAVMGGLSSAGGALLGGPIGNIGASNIGLRAGTAIGTGLGSTAGGLVTGQSLKNSLLGGVASGALSYLTPDITKALSGGAAAPTGTSTGGTDSSAVYGGPNAEIIASGIRPFTTPNINLGGFKSPTQKYLDDAASNNPQTGQPYNSGYDGDLINVTGSVPGAVTGGLNLGGLTGNPAVDRLVQTETAAPGDEDIIKVTGQLPGAVTGGVNLSGLSPEVIRAISEPEATVADDSDIIKVTGTRTEPANVISIGGNDISLDELDAIQRVNDLENANDEILVTGNKTVPVAVNLDPGIGSITDTLPLPKADPALTEKSTLDKIKDAYDIARVGAALLPLIPSGGDGDGNVGIGSGTGRGLTFTKSPLRPTLTGAGIGGTGGNYPYTPQTYGRRGGDQETEYLFFARDPVTGQGSLQSAPAPITTPIANEPAGPAMILPSDNTFAEGGEVDDDMVKHLVEYHKNGGHQGPGQVKGIGSGQDDKIPAWLSDGEYVWSAQDVADLGDGSTDEGVRRLDKMRQMVRRQAGRKDVKKIAKPQKGIDRMLKAVGGLA